MKVMVLNDGETYTDLAGCMIIEFEDGSDDFDDFDEVVKAAAETFSEFTCRTADVGINATIVARF